MNDQEFQGPLTSDNLNLLYEAIFDDFASYINRMGCYFNEAIESLNLLNEEVEQQKLNRQRFRNPSSKDWWNSQ